MTTQRLFFLLGAALFASAGCSGLRAECQDGIDNDGDGYVDANDPACTTAAERTNARNSNCGQGGSGLAPSNPACDAALAGATERDDPACADREDNDGDGYFDYPDDPGCNALADDTEEDTECNDGEDNDGDGLTDWQQDPGCLNDARTPSEGRDPVCGDGRDNDGDGRIDFPADNGCSSRTDGSEVDPQCLDGEDNDGDGQVDFPADLDCTSATADREWAYACGDGVDNDYDGAVDMDDLGCSSRYDNEETNPACSDRRDNDGDGHTDFPQDPGCGSVLDSSENQPQCSDGLDNDLNGLTDYPADPGCLTPDQDAEVSNCADGIDNDGDGLVDTPADPGCVWTLGGSEFWDNRCADGLDNDGDGLIDFPADPGCDDSFIDTTEADTFGDCADGVDNDGDGLIDSTAATHPGDPACDAGYLLERFDPICDDGADNDGDGLADYRGVDLDHDGRFNGAGELPPDPACTTTYDYREAPEPQCSDGIDNDGDGTADAGGIDQNGNGSFSDAGDMLPDWVCVMPNPNTTAIPTSLESERRRDERIFYEPGWVPLDFSQCRDGIDNDGDGLVDFQPEFLTTDLPNPNFLLHDDDCTTALDNTEGN